MKKGGFAILLLAGLYHCLPAAAVGLEVLEEIRAVLRKESLVIPNEEQLAALNINNLAEQLKRIDVYAEWHEQGEIFSDIEKYRANLGAEIYSEAGQIWLMPYADGPLMQTGMVDRLVLQGINGSEIDGLSLSEIATLLTGDPGQTKVLDVFIPRTGLKQQLHVMLQLFTPRSFEKVEVAGQTLFRILRFTSGETKVFLETALKQRNQEQTLILDLRDCQGGDLFEALDTAGMFVGFDNVLAYTTDHTGKRITYYSPDSLKIETPVVVLISRNTASAGEIFSGILQAHHRARLVGERTRGKCVSQKETILSDGSVLKFTNLSLTFSNGTSCQTDGLNPDQNVTHGEIVDIQNLIQLL